MGDTIQPMLRIMYTIRLLTPQEATLGRDIALICFALHVHSISVGLCRAGIPLEEDEDEQDTSIKGRLLMLVNKIKGQSHKAEEPTEKEQAAPCEQVTVFFSFT